MLLCKSNQKDSSCIVDILRLSVFGSAQPPSLALATVSMLWMHQLQSAAEADGNSVVHFHRTDSYLE